MYFNVADQQAALSYRRSIGFGGPAPASVISTPPKKNAPTFITTTSPSRLHSVEYCSGGPGAAVSPDRRPSGTLVPMSSTDAPLQSIVTLDLEGVLVPEIWIAVAERTGIDALRRTTRDEPDYDVLMRGRIDLLREHGLKMSDIDDVIGTLSPLDGAVEFLDELRARTQVLILSDTFEQFGRPLMRQLKWPALLCHRLVVADDRVVDYRLRMPDQKRHAVEALRGLNYRVVAAGDSYNDTAMLAAAHAGFLFHAPDNVKAEFPQFTAVDAYDDLLALIVASLT
jgi:phosphoserine/homoserine phosphotransferase